MNTTSTAYFRKSDKLLVVDEKINGLRYVYPVMDGELMEPVCSPVWKVFATMVNSNRRAQREIYEDLVGRHDYPFLTTCVSASSAVDNALLLYKPVARHRKSNPVADDYPVCRKTPCFSYGDIRHFHRIYASN